MEQRLPACSHYCKHTNKPSLPNREPQSTIKHDLIKTKSNSFVQNALKGFGRLAPFKPGRRRYCPNNTLGIFIATSCNLGCRNCQTSAKQAPANDLMTVDQIEKVVREAIDLKYYWKNIRVTGGEPTLHPQFFQILNKLKAYKEFYPACKFVLETNGAGEKVQSVLRKLPGWIKVFSSNKDERRDSYPFFSYYVAPIDQWAYRFSDFSKGCSRISECYGLCASMYGYYPCSPCMNVARVFGFDIGIKKLSLVTEKALRQQLKILCKYCGWFKEASGEELDRKLLTEKTSRSWSKALVKYAKRKPKMTLLGPS